MRIGALKARKASRKRYEIAVKHSKIPADKWTKVHCNMIAYNFYP
jgi:hypothetical protein